MILLSGTSEILSVKAVAYPERYYHPMQPFESVRLHGVDVAMRHKALTETDCKRITHLAVEVVTGRCNSLWII